MAPEKREYDQRWNKIWETGLNAGEVRNARVCATQIQNIKALYSRAVVPERFHPSMQSVARICGCSNLMHPAAPLPYFP